MDFGYLMGIARLNIKKLKLNQRFYAKDLFEESEWKKLRMYGQASFGKYFLNEVRENKVSNVQCINPDTYQRKRYIFKG